MISSESVSLTTQLRRKMRYAADAFFCRSFDDKECIGRENQWTIRTGGLNSRSVVYSGGVGEDISFETILVKGFGLSITLFDPSPPAMETVARTDMTNIEFVRKDFPAKSALRPSQLASEAPEKSGS